MVSFEYVEVSDRNAKVTDKMLKLADRTVNQLAVKIMTANWFKFMRKTLSAQQDDALDLSQLIALSVPFVR